MSRDLKTICTVGFEPNMMHYETLKQLEKHYHDCGWRVGLKRTFMTTFFIVVIVVITVLLEGYPSTHPLHSTIYSEAHEPIPLAL